MTEEDIYDLLGIFSNAIHGAAERIALAILCDDAFSEHIRGLHRALFAVCDVPLCQAAFEAEVLCDLYGDLSD